MYKCIACLLISSSRNANISFVRLAFRRSLVLSAMYKTQQTTIEYHRTGRSMAFFFLSFTKSFMFNAFWISDFPNRHTTNSVTILRLLCFFRLGAECIVLILFHSSYSIFFFFFFWIENEITKHTNGKWNTAVRFLESADAITYESR